MAVIRRKFAKNLRVFREKKGFTQEALAEKLGISARYIQQLEGKSTPNIKIDTLERLAKALKIAPEDLIR